MADMVKLDSVSKIADLFEPSVVLTALAEYDKYLMASNGRIEEYASIQMTRIEDGQPSEERTYEQWQQYFVNDDGEVWFTPYRCECDDCRFRKRPCKHLALTLLFKRFLTRDAAEERATTIEVECEELGEANENPWNADNGTGDTVPVLSECDGVPVHRGGTGRGREACGSAGGDAREVIGRSFGDGTGSAESDRGRADGRAEGDPSEQERGRRWTRTSRLGWRRRQWRTNGVAVEC